MHDMALGNHPTLAYFRLENRLCTDTKQNEQMQTKTQSRMKTQNNKIF